MKDSCFTCINSGYSVKNKEFWCRYRSFSCSINASFKMICTDNIYERLNCSLLEQRKSEFKKFIKDLK